MLNDGVRVLFNGVIAHTEPFMEQNAAQTFARLLIMENPTSLVTLLSSTGHAYSLDPRDYGLSPDNFMGRPESDSEGRRPFKVRIAVVDYVDCVILARDEQDALDKADHLGNVHFTAGSALVSQRDSCMQVGRLVNDPMPMPEYDPSHNPDAFDPFDDGQKDIWLL